MEWREEAEERSSLAVRHGLESLWGYVSDESGVKSKPLRKALITRKKVHAVDTRCV